MSKFLEYVLSLKDKITEPLRRVSANSSAAGTNVNNLQHNVQQLNTTLHATASGGLTRFNIAMGNLISQGITKLGSIAKDFISGAASGTIQRERDIIGLTTFLGDNAKRVYDVIEKDAAVTPFGLESLLSVNRALISTGMNADKARQDALNLANAVAAVGGSDDVLSRMGANMQQIANTGKASAMDIKQFAFAGINIYSLLSKATGKSVKDVHEMEVSYELLATALEKAGQKGGLYFGASEKQSKTMGGMLSTLRDGFKKFMADAGEFMRPFMEKGMAYLQRFIDNAPKILSALQPVINAFGKMFFFIIDAIGGVINVFGWWYKKIQEFNPVIIFFSSLIIYVAGYMAAMAVGAKLITLWTALWEGAQWLLNAALTANPIGIVIGLVVAFAAVIGYVIYRYNGWGAAWKNLTSFLGASWQGFKEVFNLIWLKVQHDFMSGIEFMQKGWYKFKSLWDEDGANAGLASLNDQANERVKEMAASQGKIGEYAKIAAESWNKIGLKDSGKGFSDIKNDIKNKLGLTPTASSVNTKFSGTGTDGAGGRSKKSNEAVATGGTKNTTIHIQIKEQVGKLTVMANNITEGAEKIRDIIVDEMTRAIGMAQAIADD
jgi:tape measure domain-containing protein